MAEYTIADLAASLGLEFAGRSTLRVSGVNEPARALPNELAVAMDPRFREQIGRGRARAAILADGSDWQGLGLDAAIFAPRPRLAMARLTRAFDTAARPLAGIHPTAVVDPSATIGQGAAIAAFAVIDAKAQIGANAVIGPHVWIGAGVRIGPGAWLAAGTAIAPGCRIGSDFSTHPNVAIGGDGFSFVTAEKSAVEEVRETMTASDAEPQEWIKIRSLGGVRIGDNVEIGSNSSVDAGTIRATEIGDGCKLDGLVHVGHNARIGRNCLLCGHVGVAGSAEIGDNCVLGGMVGVADNITLGPGVIAGGATKILSNVPAGRAVLGYPAMKMDTHIEVYKGLRRLPRLFSRFEALEKAVSKLTKTD